jgi:hypothetical protein
MLKNLIVKIANYYIEKNLPLISAQECKALKDLRSVASQTPVSETKNCTLAEGEWFENMNQLQRLILTADPRKFLQWDVVKRTMFINFASYSLTELRSLKSLTDWNFRWRKAIKEAPTGCPLPFVFYPSSSANLIHHAYHLSVFEQITGVKIHSLDCIMEFGGGYGSMCRIIHKLGFRGKYIIFDLPLFSALQKYFLSSIGLTILTPEQFLSSDSGVLCISDLAELTKVIASENPKQESLFIATWSISEAPIKIRESIHPLVSNFKSSLIAYQHKFGEVDNINYFDSWQSASQADKWVDFPIKHIRGNSYLIGRKAADLDLTE